MEEAEFLSDRIGIINEGQLRAVGTSAYLKNQFCNWFIVELVVAEEADALVQRFLADIGGEVVYSISELFKIKVPGQPGIYQNVLGFVERQPRGHLKTWSIKKGTLEDVFTHISDAYSAN